MGNVKEKDVRREVVRGEGASVNAESSLKLPYRAAADPVSELVWSPHTGLTLKSANPDLRKPLLLWNVGPGPAGDEYGDGDGDHHHIIIDPAAKGKELAAAISGTGSRRRSEGEAMKRKICDGSLMKWISNIATKQDSLSPLPLPLGKGKEIVEESPMAMPMPMACVFARRLRNITWGAHHCPTVTKSKKKKRREQVNEEMMFDAIRNLRLSRADIIRWMNSEAPISQLKGYFVRLRMGMGNQSTCYYVACITGDDVAQNKSIWVDVGGIKSCVATQYVSNHHFLQDEIKAWWSRTLRSGCTIPSLADLNSKFNHRQTFGF
ncbi:uncharacterized protein LOC131001096 isoform X2 [Salvia miltiorrhiza]|uniref:uncharacterized protein LOC131001096 isoform X2 n=1 Tax=Salvia miltiorrhiza TaxID=226208 RepID=UPI0025ACD3F6|nr:uncharacterized protein LOC131001096 isoform X2 [Salvia miltiorrhiza]XP_057783293.1 uncharacterized protein LOC131001096 isoform X2 [Salvia miltiorrhiza]